MYVMALSDGDKDHATFGELDGCKIYNVPDDYDGDTIPEEAQLVVVFYTYRQKGLTTWSMTAEHTR